MASFLIALREGAEAALIVGILLAYLTATGRAGAARWVWAGTLAAAASSLTAGVVLYATVGALEGRAEEIVEGVVAFAAAGLLTWMVLWMAARARTMRSTLRSGVDSALAAGSMIGLAAVAFAAVLREGLETALFLLSTTVGSEAGLGQAIGALLGLVGAVAVGYLVYRGGRRIDVRLFFRVTGALIVLFAAGLAAKGVHAFQEAAILPEIVDPLWNLGFAEPGSSTLGTILNQVLGWDPSPTLLQVVAYFAYLVPVGSLFMRGTARVAPNRPDPVAVGS